MNISVVVPVYNMGTYLVGLWRSLKSSGVLAHVHEVLIVDDGSTDSTGLIVEELRHTDSEAQGRLRLVRLNWNQGSYKARLAGAEQAEGDLLLFLDARVTLPAGTDRVLVETIQQSDFICFHVLIETRSDAFSLYWDRVHRWIFSHHYEALARGPIWIQLDNYDQFLKGTGGLVVRRDLFINACRRMGPDLYSDDTRLLRLLVDKTPLLIHPKLQVLWRPRNRWGPFLMRLMDRGPGLVEYHVLERRGWIFKVVAAVGLGIIGWFFLLLQYPALASALFLLVNLLVLSSTILFSARWREFIKMAPIHLASVWATGIGVLYGLGVHLRSWWGRKRRPTR